MKHLCHLLFVLASPILFGQSISTEALKKDLIQLQESIRKYNPALDNYVPDFSVKSDSLIASISTDSLTLIDAFQKISQLCALSEEGHFSIGNWQDTVHAGFLENTYRYIPISVRVVQGRFFVWTDVSAERSLNRGDEILSINGTPTERIRSTFLKSLPCDGEIQTYVDRKIELGFSWMYYLYVDQPESFLMVIKDAKGATKELRIRALTRKSQMENYAAYFPDSAVDDENLEGFHTLRHEEGVSFLSLPSFDYRKIKDNNIKSKSFYKSIFKELKELQTKYLVVDLRGNTGGRNEFADDMAPFIVKDGAEASFLKRTISWEGKTKTYKFPKRSKWAFDGKVYLIVDGRTFSSGNTLARYLKELAGATVIGEETGTRYAGFAAGSSQYITLINTQLRVGIPRYHILFPQSVKQTTSNSGLLPDIAIHYTIDDLIEEKDLEMDRVQSLISSNNSSSKRR